MPITPEDLVELSFQLLQNDSEASWRSSSSRSYYAAYHIASQVVSVCPDNQHFKIDTGTHGKLIDRFELWSKDNHEKSKLGYQIAYVLKDMKRSRELADYHLHKEFLKGDAQMRQKQIAVLKQRLDSLWVTQDKESSI